MGLQFPHFSTFKLWYNRNMKLDKNTVLYKNKYADTVSYKDFIRSMHFCFEWALAIYESL